MAQIKRYERTQSIPQVGPIPRQTFTYDDLGKMYQVRAAGMAQLGQQLGEMAQQLHGSRHCGDGGREKRCRCHVKRFHDGAAEGPSKLSDIRGTVSGETKEVLMLCRHRSRQKMPIASSHRNSGPCMWKTRGPRCSN